MIPTYPCHLKSGTRSSSLPLRRSSEVCGRTDGLSFVGLRRRTRGFRRKRDEAEKRRRRKIGRASCRERVEEIEVASSRENPTDGCQVRNVIKMVTRTP